MPFCAVDNVGFRSASWNTFWLGSFYGWIKKLLKSQFRVKLTTNKYNWNEHFVDNLNSNLRRWTSSLISILDTIWMLISLACTPSGNGGKLGERGDNNLIWIWILIIILHVKHFYFRFNNFRYLCASNCNLKPNFYPMIELFSVPREVWGTFLFSKLIFESPDINFVAFRTHRFLLFQIRGKGKKGGKRR